MILLAFALPAVSQPVVAAVPPFEPIAVVGRKLADTKGEVTINVLTGKAKCKVDRTSGNARVDAAVCDIAIACIRKKKSKGDAFKTCVAHGRQEFLADYSRKLESVGR